MWFAERNLTRWIEYLDDERDVNSATFLSQRKALRVRHFQRRRKRQRRDVLLQMTILFTILMTCYFLNGAEFCISHDTTASILLPLNFIKYGTLTYRPERWPALFEWKLGFENGCVLEPLHLANVTSPVASSLLNLGHLSVRRERYFMIPVHSGDGTYANIFGLGAGLTSLPVIYIMKWISPQGWTSSDGGYDALFLGAKITASLCSTIAAILLFSIIRVRSGDITAILMSLHYGLCTTVFSMASQGLWQHGPNAMYICAAMYFYRHKNMKRNNFFVGACLGAAVFCRPNSVLVTIVFVLESFVTQGIKQTIPIILGGTPFAVCLLYYNYIVLGTIFSTAQTIKSVEFLEMKGRSSLFSTPLFEGLSGLLFSPSRGLFVFSPLFMVLILISLFRQRKNHKKSDENSEMLFRPACISCSILTIFASKWYDWWGGYCYGCRPLLDVLPYLTLMLASPARYVIKTSKSRVLQLIFALCFLWGLFVQSLGVAAYNASTWNHYAYDDRGEGYALSIDTLEGRHRLWSVSQGQIAHMYNNFNHSRDLKKWKMWHYSHNTLALKLDSLFEEHETLADSIYRCARRPASTRKYTEYMRLIARSVRARDAKWMPFNPLPR